MKRVKQKGTSEKFKRRGITKKSKERKKIGREGKKYDFYKFFI